MSKQANKFSSNQKLRHVYAHIMRITIAFQRTLFHILPSAAILIACTACHTNNSWLTKSTGQPYEVLLVDDIDSIIFNELSVQQLMKHPYLNFYQAKAINEHRRNKGDLHSFDELSHLEGFRPTDLDRLRPYISFE